MSATELSAALEQYMAQLLPGARVEAQSLRQCPEIQLMLINADFPRRQLEPAVAARLMEEPPYWAFCWASGQVLARYILDCPHWVAGRHVLDFGAGSGVVGIAAMLAGASKVTCCDIDPLACLAIEANALLNGVDVSIEAQLPATRPDLITLADVLYDRDNLSLVESLVPVAPNLLLADSRVRNLRLEPFYSIGEYESSTWPDLDESREFNRVRIYCAGTMPD